MSHILTYANVSIRFPLIYPLHDDLQGKTVNYTCSMGVAARQVRALYGLMKYDTANPKRAAYMDSWHLRRLYTFSFRRQLDTQKRGQKPRDWSFENQRCFFKR